MIFKNYICDLGHRELYLLGNKKSCNICNYLEKNEKLGILRKNLILNPRYDLDILQIMKISGSYYLQELIPYIPELKSDGQTIINAVLYIYNFLKHEYFCTNPAFFVLYQFTEYLKLIYDLNPLFVYRFFKFDIHNIYFDYILSDFKYKINDYLKIRNPYFYRKFLIYDHDIFHYSKKLQYISQIVFKYDYTLPIGQSQPKKEILQYKINFPPKSLSQRFKNSSKSQSDFPERIVIKREPHFSIRKAFRRTPKRKIRKIKVVQNEIIAPKIIIQEKILIKREPHFSIRKAFRRTPKRKVKKVELIQKIEPKSIEIIQKKETIPFTTLFAIDFNNLYLSLKNKYRNFRNLNPLDFIIKYYPEEPYLSLIFCSKYLSYYEKQDKKKKNGIHKWYIESYLKNKSTNTYCDIDTALSALTYHNLFKYRKTIKKFFLFSGDKDFHILLELANRFNIDTFIIAVEEKNISSEMKQLANNFALL